MANLSADAPIRVLGEAYIEKFAVDSAAARTIYKGEPVGIDQSVDTTHVVSQAVAAIAVNDVFMGIAASGFTNALGDSETGPKSEVGCYVQPTIVGFKSAVFTDADAGKAVYMSDTATLSNAVGAYYLIGKVHRVLDGYCYVRLETPKIVTAIA